MDQNVPISPDTHTNTENEVVSPERLPGVMELLKNTLAAYRVQSRAIVAITLVPALVGIAQLYVDTYHADTTIGLVLALLGLIVSFASYLALFAYCTGHTVSISSSWKSVSTYAVSGGWIQIISLCVLLGGVFLFIIPGIAASVFVSFAFFVMFAEGVRGRESLVRSWLYVRGYWWAVLIRTVGVQFLWLLLFMVPGIIAYAFLFGDETFFGDALLTVIINMVIVPINILYMFFMYQGLRNIKGDVSQDGHAVRIRKYITVYGVLGGIGALSLIGFVVYLVMVSPIGH